MSATVVPRMWPTQVKFMVTSTAAITAFISSLPQRYAVGRIFLAIITGVTVSGAGDAALPLHHATRALTPTPMVSRTMVRIGKDKGGPVLAAARSARLCSFLSHASLEQGLSRAAPATTTEAVVTITSLKRTTTTTCAIYER